MNNLTLAVREFDGEFDAIGFNSYDEAVQFCQLRHEYRVFETQFLTVREALAIFGDEVKA